jgi:hypothetical protein
MLCSFEMYVNIPTISMIRPQIKLCETRTHGLITLPNQYWGRLHYRHERYQSMPVSYPWNKHELTNVGLGSMSSPIIAANVGA